MTGIQQRAALHRRIWQIADEVRGAVSAWDFKQYVLGALFYRFLSEQFEAHMNGGDPDMNYADWEDEDVPDELKPDLVKTYGYFIYPSQLFGNVMKNAAGNGNLNTDLAGIFKAIEASASGTGSEPAIKGLFADFDTTSVSLGNTVHEKNKRLLAVLNGIAALDFGAVADSPIDLFGDAYEFLISNYAANGGKSGGEFFTPPTVSKLIASLVLHGLNKVSKIYDPACGSGSLLLQVRKQFTKDDAVDFFGQEINHTTYNLARMNMFLHNVGYEKFNIALGNTLTEPFFLDNRDFDVIVSNPPYSIKWIGKKDPTLINDERFAPASVLAPESKADFAFVMHALHYLSGQGRAAIVCFPGIFYRGGAEQKIRKYLIDNNYVESVIALPPNLFFGTTIAVCVLTLSKGKKDSSVRFIDASSLFKKETNNNVLEDKHIAEIMRLFGSSDDVPHLARAVSAEDIAAHGYNLSVNTYVEPEDKREVIDIKKLNAEIAAVVAKEDSLRKEIDVIIAQIEGCGDA